MAAGSRCLIFYYYISGKVTLEVSSDIDKKPAKVLWSHTGDSGSDWLMVQIVLDASLPPNSKSYKIVFTATRQGLLSKTSALAIDDIQFLTEACSDANNTPSPPTTTPTPIKKFVPGDCSFDTANDLCGYASLNTTDFDWQQLKGRGTTFFTGPEKDHSGTGYYLAMDASAPATEGTLFQLVSPELKQNCSMCFTFYHYMYGNDTGSLSIKIYSNGATYNPKRISGEQGQKWKRAQVGIADMDDTYRIIIEGIVGDGYRGDIAVDDFSLRDGSCLEDPKVATADCSTSNPLVYPDTTTSSSSKPTTPSTPDQTTTDQIINSTTLANVSQYDCDFETSFCNYERSPKTDYLFSWQRVQSVGSLVPPQNGSYLLSALVGKFQSKTTITTPKMATGSTCLIFYYYISGKVTLEVSSDIDKKPSKVLWSHTGDSGSDWSMAQIVLDASPPPSNKNYKIIFTATKQGVLPNTSALAIDDIQFLTEACSDPDTTPSPPTTTPTPIKKFVPGDCSFDTANNLCGYSSLNTTDFDWQQVKGRGNVSFTGPEKDHSGTGYYLAMDASPPATEGTIFQLVSPELKQNCSMCFTVFTYMYGNDAGSLSIKIYSNGTIYNAIQFSGDQGQKWLSTQVEIVENTYRIIIEGIVGDGYGGDIAVDDFSLRDGSCLEDPKVATAHCSTSDPLVYPDTTTSSSSKPTTPSTPDQTTPDQIINSTMLANVSQYDCDFETSFCNYERSEESDDLLSWQRTTLEEASVPERNASYILSALLDKLGNETSITTPKMAAGSRCLIFYYYISGNVTLEVSSDIDKKPAKVLWSHTGDSGSDWSMVQIVLDASLPPNSKNYKIVLTASKQTLGLKNAVLAVSDMQFSTEDCAGTTPPTVMSAHHHVTTPMVLAQSTTQDNHKKVTEPVTTANPVSTSKKSTDKLAGPSTTVVKATTTISSTSTDSTESAVDNSQWSQQKLIAIVVPISIVSVLILVLVILLVLYRRKKRSSMDIQDYLYDDLGEGRRESNSAPVYINHSYSKDQDYGLTSWDKPL